MAKSSSAAEIPGTRLTTSILDGSPPIRNGITPAKAVIATLGGYPVTYAAADIVCSAIREVQIGNMYFSPTIPTRLYKRHWKKQSDRIKLANIRNTIR